MDYFRITIRIAKPRSALLRYSLRFTILVTTLASLLLAAFCLGQRFGYSDGYSAAERASMQAKIVSKTYYVGDMFSDYSNASAKLDALVTQITSDVATDTWEDSDGPCSIAAFPTNLSLIVSHTRAGHKLVYDYLEKLRP